MGIDYPLTLPDDERVTRFTARPVSSNAISESPFTFQEKVQSFPGEKWTGEIEIAPVNKGKEAGQWRSFLIKLDGRRGTFLFSDPMRRTPEGNASLSGGQISAAANPPFADLTDNQDSEVSAPDSASLDITDQVTVETWAKLPSNQPNSQSVLCGKMDALSTGSYGILDSNGNLVGWASDGGSNYLVNVTGATVYDEWAHYAWSYNSSGDAVLYVNGQQVGSRSNNATMSSNNYDFTVGFNGGDGSIGWFDHTRVWNTALSQSQIQSNMHTKLSGSESNLVLAWPYEDLNSLISAVDSTSNNNDGSFVDGKIQQRRPFEIATYGWAANESNLFEEGDYIEIANQYLMVTDPASSNADGFSVLDIKPGVRENYSAGTNVITDNPQGVFRLTTNETEYIQENITTRPMTLPIEEVVK